MSVLAERDPEIARAIEQETDRQRRNIVLIASENYASRGVLEAQGSPLTNKYAEGYPGRRYYGSCEFVDIAEQLAIDRAKQLFGVEHANVQPHSGASANMEAYAALLSPGDTVMGLRLDQGGHLTHGSKVNFSAQLYDFAEYGLDPETEQLDYEVIASIARERRPKVIVAGYTAYSRTIDFGRFRQIADEVGAVLMVDMAHIAGLVAAGVHPSPAPHAQVVTSTTHKSLRGPRGAFILSTDEHRRNVDRAVFPYAQGGPLMHAVAAKAVCFGEALDPSFADYGRQIVANAKTLASALEAAGPPHRVGRDRQPPHARRPEADRVDRPGSLGGARRRRHHRQQERHSQRPPASPRHQRPAVGNAQHHDSWVPRGGGARRRRHDRPSAEQPRRRPSAGRGARRRGRAHVPLPGPRPRLLSPLVAYPRPCPPGRR